MKTDQWMPIVIGDYLKDTRHLDTIEHGAYFLILMEIWIKKGWVEKKHLPKITLLSQKKFQKVWTNLEAFFIQKDDKISQKRALAEIEKAKVNYENSVKNGKKGGRPKKKVKPKQNPTLFKTETQNKPKENPIPNPEKTPSPSPFKNNLKVIGDGRPHKEILGEIIDFFSMSPATSSDWSRVGKLARDYGKKGMTFQSLKIRADLYRKEWPNITLTPEALLKHWDHFGEKERVIIEAEKRKREAEEKRKQDIENIPEPTEEEKKEFSAKWRGALNG